jgi:hypothetical protein
MRRPSSADNSPEQLDPNSTPDISPAPRPEHDDSPNDQIEALRVKAQGWAKANREEEEKKEKKEEDRAVRVRVRVNPPPATEAFPVLASANPTPQPTMSHEKLDPAAEPREKKDIIPIPHSIVDGHNTKWRQRLRNPWAYSPCTLVTTLLGFAAIFLMTQSFLTRQLDPKGCDMSYMRPTYSRYDQFDTEHTRFATKYSLYLYREGGMDEDTRVR